MLRKITCSLLQCSLECFPQISNIICTVCMNLQLKNLNIANIMISMWPNFWPMFTKQWGWKVTIGIQMGKNFCARAGRGKWGVWQVYSSENICNSQGQMAWDTHPGPLHSSPFPSEMFLMRLVNCLCAQKFLPIDISRGMAHLRDNTHSEVSVLVINAIIIH